MQTGAATVGNSVEFPQNNKNGTVFWPSDATSGNRYEGLGDMDHSVVTGDGGVGMRGLNGNGKNTIKSLKNISNKYYVNWDIYI